jgi:hypothetical protein
VDGLELDGEGDARGVGSGWTLAGRTIFWILLERRVGVEHRELGREMGSIFLFIVVLGIFDMGYGFIMEKRRLLETSAIGTQAR